MFCACSQRARCWRITPLYGLHSASVARTCPRRVTLRSRVAVPRPCPAGHAPPGGGRRCRSSRPGLPRHCLRALDHAFQSFSGPAFVMLPRSGPDIRCSPTVRTGRTFRTHSGARIRNLYYSSVIRRPIGVRTDGCRFSRLEGAAQFGGAGARKCCVNHDVPASHTSRPRSCGIRVPIWKPTEDRGGIGRRPSIRLFSRNRLFRPLVQNTVGPCTGVVVSRFIYLDLRNTEITPSILSRPPCAGVHR